MSNLQLFWHSWKAYGHFLGNIVGRIAMMVFYFTLFVPFALGAKLFTDPLQIKQQPTTLWRPRSTGDQALKDLLRQYTL